MTHREDSFLVSVFIPLLNEESNIPIIYERLSVTLKQYSEYEIIFIDDGSTDNSLEIIKNLAKKDSKIKFISFSRNFGHQNALRAGYDFAQGDCIICMDCDLQDPPQLLPAMINKWKEGFDIVNTIRHYQKKAGQFKIITSNLFYYLINKLGEIRMDKGSADFRLVDKRIAAIISSLKENPLFLRGMVSWLGFRQCTIDFEKQQRHSGKTKYPFSKMLKLAVAGITSFSIKPLQVSMLIGLIVALASFLYGLFAIYMRLFTNNTVPGWTSTLIIVSFIGGLQLIMIGVLGEYLGKLFIESKQRPKYLIKESNISQ